MISMGFPVENQSIDRHTSFIFFPHRTSATLRSIICLERLETWPCRWCSSTRKTSAFPTFPSWRRASTWRAVNLKQWSLCKAWVITREAIWDHPLACFGFGCCIAGDRFWSTRGESKADLRGQVPDFTRWCFNFDNLRRLLGPSADLISCLLGDNIIWIICAILSNKLPQHYSAICRAVSSAVAAQNFIVSIRDSKMSPGKHGTAMRFTRRRQPARLAWLLFEENDAWFLMSFLDFMEECCGISATHSNTQLLTPASI